MGSPATPASSRRSSERGAERASLAEAKGDLNQFYLQMDGVAVFKHAVIGFAEQIEETLKRECLRPEDIAWVVPHQANARILKAVSKRVGIPLRSSS